MQEFSPFRHRWHRCISAHQLPELPENRVLNMGFSGDCTEYVFRRILPSAQAELGKLDPPQLGSDFIAWSAMLLPFLDQQRKL